MAAKRSIPINLPTNFFQTHLNNPQRKNYSAKTKADRIFFGNLLLQIVCSVSEQEVEGLAEAPADTIISPMNLIKKQLLCLNVKGNSSLFFNGEPHGGDAYSSGWLYIPVKIKKGTQ
jgi:hypothetical protein